MPTDDQLSNELKNTERLIAAEKYKTAIMKAQFIKELKNGLGKQIKNNPGGVKIIKKTWSQRLGLFFKRIFTKF